jgi:hypothetical protein
LGYGLGDFFTNSSGRPGWRLNLCVNLDLLMLPLLRVRTPSLNRIVVVVASGKVRPLKTGPSPSVPKLRRVLL